MMYQGLPVEIVNAGLRLLRLADRSLGKREPFYKFDFQGWKLLILPPKPRVLSGENSPQNGQKYVASEIGNSCRLIQTAIVGEEQIFALMLSKKVDFTNYGVNVQYLN